MREMSSIFFSIMVLLTKNKKISKQNKQIVIKLFNIAANLIPWAIKIFDKEKIKLVGIAHKEIDFTINYLSNPSLDIRVAWPPNNLSQFNSFTFQVSRKLGTLDEQLQEDSTFYQMLKAYSQCRDEIQSLVASTLKLPLNEDIKSALKLMMDCLIEEVFDKDMKTLSSWEEYERIHYHLYQTCMTHEILKLIPRH